MNSFGSALNAVMMVFPESALGQQIVAYQNGAFGLTASPDWWYEEEWLSSTCFATSLEVGPLGSGMLARRAPTGFTVCLTGNETTQDVRTIWCPSEADYVAFLCGPGAAFVSACAQILGADPLKRGAWK